MVRRFQQPEVVAGLMALGKTRSPTLGNCLRLWAWFVTNAAPFHAAHTEEINTRESTHSPPVCGTLQVRN